MSKDDSTGKIQWDRFVKKLSPYTVQKGLRYLKHYGLKEFWIRLHERFEPEEVPYGPWYEAYQPTEEILEKQCRHKFKNAYQHCSSGLSDTGAVFKTDVGFTSCADL